MLNRRSFLKAAGSGAASLALGAPGAFSSERRVPNLVVIMADDLGPECLGCYGGTSYRTPNLDRLARTGVRFENAYGTPLCTPSRVQLMTGRYPFRTGWDNLIEREPVYGKDYLDPKRETTFAHVLQSAGYRTAVAGKWQLARFDEHPEHPSACGFDEYRLWTWKYDGDKPSRYWSPGIWQDGALLEGTEGRFGPDLYTDFLLSFFRRNRARPILAYYPMALTHGPFVAPPGTGGAGSRARSRPEVQQNFGTMVTYMDHLVGRIVGALDELGLRENTLILFTGDNGSPRQIRSRLGRRTIPGEKAHLTEAGARVPLIANWKGTTPEGRVSDALVDFSDLLPTCAEMAGTPPPVGTVLDGRSLLPLLQGRAGRERDWIYCQLQGDWFIRSKRWRLRKNGELADMTDRYAPRVVAEPGPEARAARERLTAWAATLRRS